MPGKIRDKFGAGPNYESPMAKASLPARLLPSLTFYAKLFSGPVVWLCARAARGQCDDAAWIHSSAWFCDVLESCGCKIIVEGIDRLQAAPKPCVIAANHMSTLETFLLPALVRPFCPVTFVVKKSLVDMPFFGPVMRSRNPVVVERVNPRADLQTVLEEGVKRLHDGISVIVFPQSTRTSSFSAGKFNSIAVKLARRANAPILPLALKTDVWGQGKKIKELGRFAPRLPARFKFGEAISINGNGKAENAAICDFIASTISGWQKTDGVNS